MRETEDRNRKLLQTRRLEEFILSNIYIYFFVTQSSLQIWYNPCQNPSEVLQDIEKNNPERIHMERKRALVVGSNSMQK